MGSRIGQTHLPSVVRHRERTHVDPDLLTNFDGDQTVLDQEEAQFEGTETKQAKKFMSLTAANKSKEPFWNYELTWSTEVVFPGR